LSYVDSGNFGADSHCYIKAQYKVAEEEWQGHEIYHEYDSVYAVARRSRLDLDQFDNPSVLYYETDPAELRLATYNPTPEEWEETTVAATDNIAAFDLAVSKTDGTPHVAYSVEILPDQFALYYGYHDGADWQVSLVGAAVTAGEHLSLVLTDTGYPGICYYDHANAKLCYSSFGGTFWVTKLVDNAGDVGQGCDVALDSEGGAHFSYYDATHGLLKYAYLP
jgi:hypothetical protein